MKRFVKSQQLSFFNGYSKFWIIFLVVTSIGVATPAGVVYLFFQVIRHVNSQWEWVPYRVLRQGVRFLLQIQPWLDPVPDLALPKTERKIMLVSNHRSHLDVFLYLSQIERLRVVAKQKLFQIPILGLAMKGIHQIPISANDFSSFRKATQIMKQGMRKGDRILFFPELTRCERGFYLTNKFSLIPFIVAQEERSLIIPLVIWNSDSIWPKNVSGIRFKAPFDVQVLNAVDSTEFSGPHELRKYVQDQINIVLKEKVGHTR